MSLLAVSVMMFAVGCDNSSANTNTEVTESQDEDENSDEDEDADEVVIEDTDAVTVLQNIWDEMAEEGKFPCFGGSIESSVDGAPGEVATSDENMLTNTLLVPEDVQGSAVEVASLVHMMNTNTFTGASIKLDGISASDAADKIKDNFMNTQFVCGIPEKISIAVYGDYVVYAYGDGVIVDDFMSGISALNGAEIVVDQKY